LQQRHDSPIGEDSGQGDDDPRASASAAVVTVLTTEHFTLQGARAATTSESTARAALFVGAVSSGLIALGFVGQASKFGSSFEAFALVVLPTLFALGVFTFVRLVQSSTEDLLYGRAINRIRAYYRQLAGEHARYLLLSDHDDVYGVLANMGMRRPPRWQLWFTLAAMVAVLNAVIAGATLALIVGKLANAGLSWALIAGAAATLSSLYALARVQSRMHLSARGREPALFPSPEASPQTNGRHGAD
jgi:hypothetical protein